MFLVIIPFNSILHLYKLPSGALKESQNRNKHIASLEKVEDEEEAKSAKLKRKGNIQLGIEGFYPFTPLQKLKLCESAYSILVLDQIQYFIALKILWIQGFYEMVALPEWLGNLSSLQKLYIVDCNHLLHLPTEEAMRRLTQLKTLEIYDRPSLEDNERSNIDHIALISKTKTNSGSWQEVCNWENN